MPITAQQILVAQQQQFLAARDLNPRVRLIAGPGTGKSRCLEERVDYLLSTGVLPAQIFVISFTRASARDLDQRIVSYCTQTGRGPSPTSNAWPSSSGRPCSRSRCCWCSSGRRRPIPTQEACPKARVSGRRDLQSPARQLLHVSQRFEGLESCALVALFGGSRVERFLETCEERLQLPPRCEVAVPPTHRRHR